MQYMTMVQRAVASLGNLFLHVPLALMSLEFINCPSRRITLHFNVIFRAVSWNSLFTLGATLPAGEETELLEVVM